MMALRELVRRFARFPQMIIVDGGAEFESVYFETLLARYECTKKTRPPAEARFGSVCERLFGTTNTMFIHNLKGNTQLMKNPRQVTKSINPKHHAVWTLGDLFLRFCEFAYKLYDTLTHPSLGTTPRETFALGIKRGGMRAHRIVHYSEDFLMFTLPTTRKGTAKIRCGKGIKINNIYYWSEAFRRTHVERKNIEVRYDPCNAGIAYAYVGGHWIECKSQYWGILRGRSEREVMLATKELRRRKCLHSQEIFTVTARRLAEFLESLEAQEVLLEQRLRDQEARRIVASIENRVAEGIEADDFGLRLEDPLFFRRSRPRTDLAVRAPSLRATTAGEQFTGGSKHAEKAEVPEATAKAATRSAPSVFPRSDGGPSLASQSSPEPNACNLATAFGHPRLCQWASRRR